MVIVVVIEKEEHIDAIFLLIFSKMCVALQNDINHDRDISF